MNGEKGCAGDGQDGGEVLHCRLVISSSFGFGFGLFLVLNWKDEFDDVCLWCLSCG